ncbi:MAG: endonuclease/exonuclease/phosphatase family protein [Clostridia bacterium]|nr:endonuclease/exonuclease/phosphatase family protein [Clostridia bacterium]
MKKILAVIILMLMLSGVFALSATGVRVYDPDAPLTVMSFNIRTITLESSQLNNWDNRTDSILGVIEGSSPDIIGFQELKEIQYDFFKEQLGGEYGFYGLFRDNIPFFSEAAAVFYKKKRFSVLEENTFWLSETPDEMSRGWDAGINRICTQVRLKDKKSGAKFVFLNTHFDHQGDVARSQSVELIKSRIEALACPAILTGDFNFNELSPNYTALTQGILKDVKYAAAVSDSGGTFNGFGGSNGVSPIDYILVSDGHFAAQSYEIIRTPNPQGTYPSDHFPIKAVIRFK